MLVLLTAECSIVRSSKVASYKITFGKNLLLKMQSKDRYFEVCTFLRNNVQQYPNLMLV